MALYLKSLSIFAVIFYTASSPLKNLVTDDLQYRLPTDIVPTHYQLDLQLEESSFETNTFSGIVSISIQAVNPVNQISLHYQDITVKTMELTGSTESVEIASSEYDEVTSQLIILTTVTLSTTETYSLTISYEGILSETSMSGFYKSSYEEDGLVNYLATTQFEPTYARQAFPSFDEPRFKASFDITITFPKGYSALANTRLVNQEDVGDGSLQKATFQTTPKMSTYLIAFIVSKFACEEGESIDQIPTSVCSRRGAQNTAKLAVATAPKVLKMMEDYTGYKYANSNITKLTQVAIPDFSLGAMENWGLVTFREADLLWDEDESSNAYEERVVSVVAHELSHQWFGDLVTLNWWANIFLNEGFATYFEYYVTDAIYPDWDFTKQFAIEQVQGALSIDSSTTSLPLSYNVETPESISARFDTISYNKGGSVLRMVHHFLGLEKFKAGLTDYIAENKFSNSNPTILWSSFEKYADQLPETQSLPDKVTVVMENWTNKSGYPLLTVSSDGNDVVISQEQFLFSGTSDVKWYVPISYSGPNGDFDDTTTKVWLTPSEDLVIPDVLSEESPWIILNNQQTGFYRIDYDDDLWAKISQSLNSPDFDGIDILSRSQIVDDLLNLARANKKDYSQVLDLLSYLKNEQGYYPWYSAISGFSYVLNRIGSEDLVNSFSGYISDLLQELYASTPFSDEQPDDHVYTRKQILALTWACNLNNEDCITNSKQLFGEYRDQSKKPSRNLRSIIYCNGLRYSDNVSEDFDFLWSTYGLTQLATERVTILRSLGCATDETVLKRYLQLAITEESGIRRQDATYVFSSVYSNSVEGIDVVVDFVINNYEDIVAHFGSTSTLNSLISSVASSFTSESQIDKLKEFIDNDKLDDIIKTSTSETIKTAEANLEVTKALEEQLGNYFASKKLL